MVANVLPLGCPLPGCQGRMCDPHPSQTVERALPPPYEWSPRDPHRRIPAGTLHSLSSPLRPVVLRRVHSVTVVHSAYIFAVLVGR